MKLQQIYDDLNEISPFMLQESWDNSGINVGDGEMEIESITTCLDASVEIAKNIAPKSLILAHHPLIFRPLKSLNTASYPGNIIKILNQKESALIALHTNFDYTHLNEHFAKNALGFQNAQKLEDGLTFSVETSQKFDEILESIASKLALKQMRFVKSSDNIEQILIVCGAGLGVLKDITQQGISAQKTCLITGDLKHHDAAELRENGISAIEVEHFESEKFFAKIAADALTNRGYKCIIADLKNPFQHRSTYE